MQSLKKKNQVGKLCPVGWMPVFVNKVLFERGPGLQSGRCGKVMRVQGGFLS